MWWVTADTIQSPYAVNGEWQTQSDLVCPKDGHATLSAENPFTPCPTQNSAASVLCV